MRATRPAAVPRGIGPGDQPVLARSGGTLQALKLDPTLVRAYNRRGALQFLIKEYHKSLESYEKVRIRVRRGDGRRAGGRPPLTHCCCCSCPQALKLEPDNAEAKDGLGKTVNKIREGSGGGDDDRERASRAMADPEIQASGYVLRCRRGCRPPSARIDRRRGLPRVPFVYPSGPQSHAHTRARGGGGSARNRALPRPSTARLLLGRAPALARTFRTHACASLARALATRSWPTVQAIMMDPMVNQAIQDLQSDPTAYRRVMGDPVMGAKIQKLIAAGVLGVDRGGSSGGSGRGAQGAGRGGRR